MKIKNPTIINGTNYSEWAVDNIIENLLTIDLPRIQYTDDNLDYSFYKDDIDVSEEGVLIPTEYAVSYQGSNDTDDFTEYSPVDYKVVATMEDLNREVMRLVEENDNEVFQQVISAFDKN